MISLIISFCSGKGVAGAVMGAAHIGIKGVTYVGKGAANVTSTVVVGAANVTSTVVVGAKDVAVDTVVGVTGAAVHTVKTIATGNPVNMKVCEHAFACLCALAVC